MFCYFSCCQRDCYGGLWPKEDPVTEESLWGSGEIMGHASSHPMGEEVSVSVGATVSSAQYPVNAHSHTAINIVKSI